MISQLLILSSAAPMWDFSDVESMGPVVIGFLVAMLLISILAGVGWFLVGLFRGGHQ